MALQITNPVFVGKVEALERATGAGKAAAVETAVDMLSTEQNGARSDDVWEQFDAILAQVDRITDLPTAFDRLN